MKPFPPPLFGFHAWHTRPVLFLLIAVIPALLIACRQKPAETRIDADVLAVIGDRTITVEEFKKELARRTARPANAEPNSKQALLEEMMRFEALYQRARQNGYDQHPDVTANLKRMVVAKFQEDEMQKLGHVNVSDQEIQTYYETNHFRFGTPEMRRGALLFMRLPSTASAEKRAELAVRMEMLRQSALTNDANGFGALVVSYSEDQATRYQGGNMGWCKAGPQEKWEQAVADALFGLKNPNEISPVVTTQKGSYLVKLVDTKPASLRPLLEVKEGIQYLLAQQKQKEMREMFLAAQKAGLLIDVNQAALDAIPLPEVKTVAKTPPPRTPAM